MQAACLVCSLAVLISGVVSAAPAVAGNLTASQKSAIGRKIWQNECAGSVAGLTTWNAGEEFPSLGIGHFIWYPAGFKGRFEESWPQFAAFARQRGADLPAVALEAHSPWKSKAEFQAEFKGPRLTALRTWLSGNVTLQTDFIIARSRAALPKILAAAPASEKARIEANYQKVATTPQGTYALIDYVNFKGDGTQASEKYNGQGWGLMQVLGGMKDVPAGAPAAAEFAASAKRMLSRRIANSPPARGEKRWEEGWHNRCNTYARPL
ncbi:MAG: hypothetical protein V4819_07685 [Verrucomicrobiota bacterium]